MRNIKGLMLLFALIATIYLLLFMEGFNVWFFLGSLGSMRQYTVIETDNTHRKILGVEFFSLDSSNKLQANLKVRNHVIWGHFFQLVIKLAPMMWEHVC